MSRRAPPSSGSSTGSTSRRPADIQRGVQQIELDLVLFDLPFGSGSWLGGRSLEERKEALDAAVEFGDRVLRSDPIPEHGIALFEAARAGVWRALSVKRCLSHYLPGKRTRDWLKVKTVYDIDVVIGGYSPGPEHPLELAGGAPGGSVRRVGAALHRLGRHRLHRPHPGVDQEAARRRSLRRRVPFPSRCRSRGPAGSSPGWWVSSSTGS